MKISEAERFEVILGKGIWAYIDGEKVLMDTPVFIEEEAIEVGQER